MNRKRGYYLAIAAYFIGLLLGLLLKFNTGAGSSQKMNAAFNSIYSQSKFTLFWDIFFNNILVLIFNLMGALSFGIISLITTLYNGVILGYTVSSLQKYFSTTEILSHTLPHCIEVVGIILSCKLGVELGWILFKRYFEKITLEIDTAYYLRTFGLAVTIILLASGLEVAFMR
ncbi:stage II sporulation protein M [Dyadobacter sp. 22481]|uniref:stage II sporulation protein M n=1 Tax=Dyadobacter sp. 22481 TaxID=3453926 RepID=UPI003F8384CC